MKAQTFILALLVYLSAACNKEEKTTTPSSLDRTFVNLPTEVKVESAINKAFHAEMQVNGTAKATQQTVLSCDVSGTIIATKLQDGKIVQKNDTLIWFDQTELQLQINRAKIQYEKAKIDYQDKLLSHNQSGKKIPQDLEQRLQILSGITEAKQQLEELAYKAQKHCVLAPFSGVIANTSVQQYDHINAGSPLAILYKNEPIYIETNVIQSAIHTIRKGQKAHVICSDKQGSAIEGVIEQINPLVDINGMVKISLKINKNPDIYPGLKCIVQIKTEYKSTLVINKKAVVMRSGKPIVFTAQEGKAQWKEVELGLENSKEVQILSGLSEGDLVIVSNNIHLDHLSEIQITK